MSTQLPPSHSSLDPIVTSILDRPTTNPGTTQASRSPSPALSDASLDDLLSDPTTSALREARLQQLKSEQSRLTLLRTSGHGSLSLLDEKPAMDAVNSAPHSILLFTHPDFPRCKKMLETIRQLAELHVEVRFVGVNAEDAKWLAGKMGVRVLPVVVGFVGGKEVGRLTGWEGVRGGEKGGLEGVEEVLVTWGVAARKKAGTSAGTVDNWETGRLKTGRVGKEREGEDDDDDDWEWD
ncbi:MAG: hypothetical protein MMC23_008042 [Stictis urceolatum]|nr:hypothetical protein [Stictis urceolata]